MHAAHAAPAEHHRALQSRPGPAPITSTSFSAFAAGSKRSGCQPRRYSSPAVAFLRADQRRPADLPARDADVCSRCTPGMSSSRPSSIFCGRNGSEIDGLQVGDDVELAGVDRVGPSQSGFVQRPTPSTGFFETDLTAACPRKLASLPRRSGTASRPRPHSEMPETLTSPHVDKMVDELDETRSASRLELACRPSPMNMFGRDSNGDGAVRRRPRPSPASIVSRPEATARGVFERAAVPRRCGLVCSTAVRNCCGKITSASRRRRRCRSRPVRARFAAVGHTFCCHVAKCRPCPSPSRTFQVLESRSEIWDGPRGTQARFHARARADPPVPELARGQCARARGACRT